MRRELYKPQKKKKKTQKQKKEEEKINFPLFFSIFELFSQRRIYKKHTHKHH